MKPAIIIDGLPQAQAPQGLHNERLEKSRARIVDGATWKKQRTIILIPTGKFLPVQTCMALWGLIIPPNQPCYRYACVGDEVGIAYSNAIETILQHPELSTWEYILTVEHDNIPPADGLLKLIKRMEAHKELDCIGGLYWVKGEGGCPQIWGDIKDPQVNYRPQPPDPNGGLVECYGTGMGFNLWRLKMFKDKKLRKPWFKTVAGAEGVGTQDLYFWADARKHGYRCAIDCDVKVGHLDPQTGIIW